jgi:protease-4
MRRALTVFAVLLFVAAASAERASAGTSAADSLGPVVLPFMSDIYSFRFVADADDAAALFVNPAGLGVRKDNSTLFGAIYQYDRIAEVSLGLAGENGGIGYLYQNTGAYTSHTYLFGLGAKLLPSLYAGTSLRWQHSDIPAPDRSPFAVDVGFLSRPHRYVSIGGLFRNVNNPRFIGGRLEESFTGGVSLRPMCERVTLSAQGDFVDKTKPGWLFGGRFTVVPGIELYGAYARDYSMASAGPYEEFTAGIVFALDRKATRYMARSRVDGEYDYGRYGLIAEAAGSYAKSIFTPRRYAEVTIEGSYLDEGGGFALLGDTGKDLHAILSELDHVRKDPDIKGLFIKIKPIKGSFIGPVSANLNEIRKAIEEIRGAGKPVVALLKENATAPELYLASAANRIVMPEEGVTGMVGVSLELNRMKRLFAKLGIDWDFYTAGEYKSSFHTPYTDTTTALQAEELQSLVDESYRLLVEGIARGRGMSVDKMLSLADGRMFDAEEAIEAGLVDRTGREKEAKEELGLLAEEERPDRIKTGSIAGRTYREERWTPPPAVAIVGAYGSIRPGKSKRDLMSGARTMGPETVTKQLEAASRNPAVRAIVFRVDSGGGSAIASNDILTALRRIQDEKGIPIVVSMGNVAGSGGYWISMYGDAIFADPFTITGSIGVVFAKPVIERLYEKVGITNEVFKAGEHSDAMSPSRNLTNEEMELLGGYIDGMYEYFLEHVSASRNIGIEEVKRIARGRVYFGTQAQDIRLIDELGGLGDAVEHAASMAGIEDDYRTIYYKAFPGLFWRIEEMGAVGAVGRALGSILGGDGDPFDEVVSLY